MKIVYVAKHGSGDNEDEDAITFALRKLGHEVVCVTEREASHTLNPKRVRLDADFVLFHKWNQADMLYKQQSHPHLVFWDFDMVDCPDPTLERRCHIRKRWHSQLLPHILCGFLTDGDWVSRDKTGKLVHLLQGADERKVGYGENTMTMSPLVFTGTTLHGRDRQKHIQMLVNHYGDKLSLIGHGHIKGRLHGRELANLFASTKIAIAPNGPNTDLYWSNRVYLTLGLGGFLIHPFCRKLTEHYSEDELAYYRSHDELIEKIDYYLSHDDEREALRLKGHQKTLSHNLYRHRCEKLIETVKERMGA